MSRLDRTAEKSLLLRLPCLILLTVLMLTEKLSYLFRCDPDSDRPRLMRMTAAAVCAAFVGMTFAPLNDMIAISAAAEQYLPYESDWSIGYEQYDKSTFSLDRNIKTRREYSFRIQNDGYNDASIVKTIAVEPYTRYRISASVRYEGYSLDRSEGAAQSGASIGLAQSYEQSDFVTSSAWQRISYEFATTNETQVTLALRNGMYHALCKGTAWFSDIQIEQDMNQVSSEWSILALVFRNVDAEVDLGDGDTPFARNFSEFDMMNFQQVIGELKTSPEQLSNGLMKVRQVDVAGLSTPVTKLKQISGFGYGIDTSSFEVSSALDYYLSLDNYDQIIAILPTGEITSSAGIACADYKGVNLAQMSFIPGDTFKSDNPYFPESEYMRQIVRCLESDSKAYNYATPSADDYASYGYTNDDGGAEWFAAYMQSKLPHYMGIDPRVYKRGTAEPSYVFISGSMTADEALRKGNTLVPVDKASVRTSAGDSFVTLSWGYAENAESYNIYVLYPNGSLQFAGSTRDTSYTVTGLTNNSLYGFLVRSAAGDQVADYSDKDFVYDTPHTNFHHIYIAQGITVSNGGAILNDGDVIHNGDIIAIYGEAAEGMTITVNGTPVMNGATYHVDNADVFVKFDVMPNNTYPWETTTTVPTSVTTPTVTTVTTAAAMPTQTTAQQYIPIVTAPPVIYDPVYTTRFDDPIYTRPVSKPTETRPTGNNGSRVPAPVPDDEDIDEVPVHPSELLGNTDADDLTLYSELTKLSRGKIRMRTLLSCFSTSADVRLRNSNTARANALSAADALDDGRLLIYSFEANAYKKGTSTKTALRDNGYITFEIPVPQRMVSSLDTLQVYDTSNGYPRLIDSEIVSEGGGIKVVFTIHELSTLMFTVKGEDLASTAGIMAEGTVTDMGMTSTGLAPSALLPAAAGGYGRKRRFRIVRRRRKWDVRFLR